MQAMLNRMGKDSFIQSFTQHSESRILNPKHPDLHAGISSASGRFKQASTFHFKGGSLIFFFNSAVPTHSKTFLNVVITVFTKGKKKDFLTDS